MSDLEPCPFCGATEISDGEVLTEHDGTTYTQSECQGCGALGPRGHLLPGEVDYGDAKAIEAWNRRAQPAQAGQVLADDEIDPITMAQWGEMRGHPLAAHRAYARAIESAVLARVAWVPMTPEETDAAMKLLFYPARNRAFVDGVEAAERHHGIVGEKGGQHG